MQTFKIEIAHVARVTRGAFQYIEVDAYVNEDRASFEFDATKWDVYAFESGLEDDDLAEDFIRLQVAKR